MGYCENSGMGYVALSFTEIYNYMKATQTPLTPSEVMLIRKASQSYVSETYNKNPFAKEPYFVEKEMLKEPDFIVEYADDKVSVGEDDKVAVKPPPQILAPTGIETQEGVMTDEAEKNGN